MGKGGRLILPGFGSRACEGCLAEKRLAAFPGGTRVFIHIICVLHGAAMESLNDITWDVLLSGTGLPQSLLAL